MASALERSGSSLAAQTGLSPAQALFVSALSTNLSIEERVALLTSVQSGGSAQVLKPVDPSASKHAPRTLRSVLAGAPASHALSQPTALHFASGWSVGQFLYQVSRAYGTEPLAQLRDSRGGAVYDLGSVASSGPVESPTSGGGGGEVFTLVPAEAAGDPDSVPSGLVAAALRGGASAAGGAPLSPGAAAFPASDPLYASLSAAVTPALEVAEYRVLARAGWRDFRLQSVLATTGAYRARRQRHHNGGSLCIRVAISPHCPLPSHLSPLACKCRPPPQTTEPCLRRAAPARGTPSRVSCTL